MTALARVGARVPASVGQLRHVLPAVALLWLPVGLAVWGRLPGSRDLEHGLPLLRAFLIGGLGPLLVAAGMARLKGRSWRAAGQLLWSEGWLTERPVRHLLLSVSLAAFFWAYACWKSAIPALHGFTWDRSIWSLGAQIHGGQPDMLLAPWFGAPRTLVLLDRLYETWWYVLFVVLLWEIWQPELEKAKRFLLAFALSWIVLGIFVATAFASAGPCFAWLITGTHRYDALLARLNEANTLSPLLALQGQHYLWAAYSKGIVVAGGGIAAFPSLHVGGAALCALALQGRSRLLGAVAWAYVALTWVASIMLGWHYTLDGEAAVVGVLLCWVVAGVLTTPLELGVPVFRRTWATPDTASPATAPIALPAEGADARPKSPRSSWTLWP